MDHYLCISIGPVQDFIASARRCRDLWFGSHLLSLVSKAAARGLHESGVPIEKLVFPAPQQPSDLTAKSELSVANRVVAIVQDPQKAAEAARAACQAELRHLWSKALVLKDRIDQSKAEQQIDDLLEFYWVAVPMSKPSDYSVARKQAERLMAARKNTRTFSPATWSAAIEKSSLDGQRERVLDIKKVGDADQRRWGLRPGEQLCGVGVLKRFGSMHPEYRAKAALSTSHVASRTWYSQNARQSRALDEFVDRIRECNVSDEDLFGRDNEVDGHLLYEERLLTYVSEDHQDQARQALKALFRQTGGRPTPYYTILLADGDRMGEAIDQADFSEHRRLTQKLSEFAGADVARTVKNHHGYLIYAGGDDILAMLPVDQALGCAAELAEKFKEAMSSFGRGPTLSVGLAVRHHMDPLSEGLEAARRAEKKAKETRNSLAISLDKRGGSEVVVAGPWGEFDRRLERFAEMSPFISVGFAYELRQMSSALGKHDSMREVLAKETLRIALRKKGEKRGLTKEEAKELSDQVKELGADKIAQELIVSRFFSSLGGVEATEGVEHATATH